MKAKLFIPSEKSSNDAQQGVEKFNSSILGEISCDVPSLKNAIQIETKGGNTISGFDKVKTKKKRFIYFIQNSVTKSIKIGYAANPYAHCGQLQTGNEHFLMLLGCIEGRMEQEARIHNAFDENRIFGEWFRPNEEIKQLILKASFYPDL